MDYNLFYQGKMFDAYDHLGSHSYFGGVYFCTYAPNAQKVAVIGSFNNWFPQQMERNGDFWSIDIKGAMPNDLYKYVIYTRNGETVEHCDPYGFGMELRPNWASVVRNLDEYHFTDDEWISKRDKNYNKPLNIYEMHLGSWKKKNNAE